MRFEYDRVKSLSNLDKHGIDFDQAQQIWDGFHIKAHAKRRGERRYAVVGVALGSLWTAIATERSGAVRIISVRRSTAKERSAYVREENKRR